MVNNQGPSWAGAVFGVVIGVVLSIWMGWGGTTSVQTKEVIKEEVQVPVQVPVQVTKTVEVVNTQRIKELELQLQISQADLAKAKMDRETTVKKLDAVSLELKNVQYEAITYRNQRDGALSKVPSPSGTVEAPAEAPASSYYAPRRRGLFGRRW